MDKIIIFRLLIFSVYYILKSIFKNKSCSKNCNQCKKQNQIEIINKTKKRLKNYKHFSTSFYLHETPKLLELKHL